MSKQSLIVQIMADASRYTRGLGQAASATGRFGASARAELSRLKSFATSLHGQLAGLGIGVGLAKMSKDTAVFERDMRQLQVNIGATREEMEAWRKEAFENQKRYGTLVSDQKELADSLQAAGLDLDAVRAAAEPVSKTLAVAKTNADALGKAMGVAREQFGVDITSKAATEELLDKMVVAGRLGNAELENLPDIFARVGGRAKEANFTLDQTLALTEALSKSEPQADRLATLVDSTLRIFTNAKYMRDATDATGVNFFDSKGARRNPIDVIKDMKIAYDRLTTDAQRNNFLDKAFGKTDMDTQRGLKKALEDGTLGVIDQFYKELQNASGTINKDLKTAMNNAVTQANRLKGALQESVENGLARPLGDAFSGVVKKLMDSKEEGGWGLTGNQMLAGGAAAGVGAYALGRFGGGLLGKFGRGITGTASGVAAGKALEQAAGVQPVYVVNMAEGGMSGGAGDLLSKGGKAGRAGGFARYAKVGGSLALAAAPLAAMYGVSEWASQRDKYDSRAKSMVEFSGGLEQTFRKMFGWAGYETQQEKYLKTRADQLRDLNPKEAQNYQAQYEKVKALLDGTAQQSEAAIKNAGDAVVNNSNAVQQALLAQVGQTKIQGDIGIQITAAPGLMVQASAVGNSNTQLNVGKTNTGAK